MESQYFYAIVVAIIMYAIYQYIYPVVRNFRSYYHERWELERKSNRLLRARKDMLNHFDWANARGSGESMSSLENMGREIERMDQEMRDIREEI